MNEVLRILIERDKMTQSDAINYYNNIMEAVWECINEGRVFDAEDIFTSEFGLEPDYLLNILY